MHGTRTWHIYIINKWSVNANSCNKCNLCCEITYRDRTCSNVRTHDIALLFWAQVVARAERKRNVTVERKVWVCIIICYDVVQNRHVKVLICIRHCVESLFIGCKNTLSFVMWHVCNCKSVARWSLCRESSWSRKQRIAKWNYAISLVLLLQSMCTAERSLLTEHT